MRRGVRKKPCMVASVVPVRAREQPVPNCRSHGRPLPRAARLRTRHRRQRAHLPVGADPPHPRRRPRARSGLRQRRHRALSGRARWRRRRPDRRPDPQPRRSPARRAPLPPRRGGRPRILRPARPVRTGQLRRRRLRRRAGAPAPAAARDGPMPPAAGRRRPRPAVRPQRRLRGPGGRADGGRIPLPARGPAGRHPPALLHPPVAAALSGRPGLDHGQPGNRAARAAGVRIPHRLRHPAAGRGAPPAGPAGRADLPVHHRQPTGAGPAAARRGADRHPCRGAGAVHGPAVLGRRSGHG